MSPGLHLVIVVTSDQHLGYENSDKKAFNLFLDQLLTEDGVTDFVLLGDVVDMWRRDASGVFLESKDVLTRVTALQKKMRVHYVAGNHDFHVLKLQNHSYPFTFLKNLSLTEASFKYRFLHGYEFDSLQREPLMEALCRVLSDGAGEFESGAWATITREWSDLKYFFSSIFRKRAISRTVEKLQQIPELRLKDSLTQVEKLACSNAQPGEVLIFGHTHRPFVNKSENVVNSGSWVTDAPVHNTYVRLEGGKPRLFVFGGGEITERIVC